MSSVNPHEIAQFSRHAVDWWNPHGKFRPLHRLNAVRVEYVRDRICAHYERTADKVLPLKNLKILDVGCGGGLLAEPLQRMGGHVTGLDASAETIAVARKHAKGAGLKIDYHVGSVEEFRSMLQGRLRPSPSPLRGSPPSPPRRGRGQKAHRAFGVRGGKTFDVITALEIAEHVADMDSFLRAIVSLLKPDGLLIMSTLNRTPKSFLLGIVAAEYILGWVPRGTHQWQKFIRPSELVRRLEANGMITHDLTGLIFNPMRGEFELHANDLDVNYMLTASTP